MWCSTTMLHTCKGPYLLAETWASGQENGRDLLETREEQQLAKQQEMAAVNLPLNAAAGAK